MSTTMVQSMSSPWRRKKEEEAFELRKPSGNLGFSSPSNNTSQQCSPTLGQQQEQQPQKKLNQMDKLILREKARQVMTPPPNHNEMNGNEDNKKEENHPAEALRTPFSVAIALKTATSPTVSSFPDEFWIPFVEQEEYDRNQLLQLQLDHEKRQLARRQRQQGSTSARRNLFAAFSTHDSTTSSTSSTVTSLVGALLSRVTMTLFRIFWNICVYAALLLLLASLLDVPYFRRMFEVMALVGRVTLGLMLWFYDFLANSVIPLVRGWLSDKGFISAEL